MEDRRTDVMVEDHRKTSPKPQSIVIFKIIPSTSTFCWAKLQTLFHSDEIVILVISADANVPRLNYLVHNTGLRSSIIIKRSLSLFVEPKVGRYTALLTPRHRNALNHIFNWNVA